MMQDLRVGRPDDERVVVIWRDFNSLGEGLPLAAELR
jgi:hypothetical protein